MTQVYVRYNEENEHSYHSEEEYGEWSESNYFTVERVFVDKPDHMVYTEQFNLPFEVNVGDKVFVLYIVYSTGDSFGNGTGYGEVQWVFKDPSIGLKAVKEWEKNEGVVRFEIEVGSVIKLYNPAHGYFEDLESVELKTMIVQQSEYVV